MNVTAYITQMIEHQNPPFWIKGLLNVLSRCFRAIVTLRHLAFDRRWIKQERAVLPVISIGNIVAGGTGKTAFVQRLVKDLSFHGQVAVLSRGYRSRIEKEGGNVVFDTASATTPSECGDEPYLLLKTVPNVRLIVGKNRVISAQLAQKHVTDWLVLDDGMQYRRLHRDIEIVMLHAADLYGKGAFLPKGYLRELPERLKYADLIVIHHIEDGTHYKELKAIVRSRSQAPIIGTQMKPTQITLLEGQKIPSLRGKRIGVFCGLGSPTAFFRTLEKMGVEIVEQWILPDHTAPTIKELKIFSEKCIKKRCDFMVCSEKDGVKLLLDENNTLPIAILQASMEIVAGEQVYEKLLQRIIKLRQKEKRT